MEAHGVVPDVVDVAPKDVVRVSYDGGQSAANGNELTPTQVRNHPVDISWPIEEDVLYTLCLTGWLPSNLLKRVGKLSKTQ